VWGIVPVAEYGQRFRTYIVEKDQVVSETRHVLDKDPAYRNADPYSFWATQVSRELRAISGEKDYELVILEGIYALDM